MTTSAPQYGPSPSYTLTLVNSALLAEYDTSAYDAAGVKCTTALNRAVGKLVATEEAGLATEKVEGTVARACGDAGGALSPTATMLGKLAKERDKAAASIAKACAGFDADAVARHLGEARCTVEHLLALANPEAHEVLEGVTDGGQPVAAALGCLVPISAHHDE